MKFREFMRGRYGNDEFNSFCLWLYVVLLVLNIFLKIKAISLLVALLAVIIIYRVFSKKIFARQAENRKYLEIRNKIYKKIRLYDDMAKSRKTNIFRKCPSCKAVLKLPKIRGEHKVTCPRCGRQFNVKCR